MASVFLIFISTIIRATYAIITSSCIGSDVILQFGDHELDVNVIKWYYNESSTIIAKLEGKRFSLTNQAYKGRITEYNGNLILKNISMTDIGNYYREYKNGRTFRDISSLRVLVPPGGLPQATVRKQTTQNYITTCEMQGNPGYPPVNTFFKDVKGNRASSNRILSDAAECCMEGEALHCLKDNTRCTDFRQHKNGRGPLLSVPETLYIANSGDSVTLTCIVKEKTAVSDIYWTKVETGEILNSSTLVYSGITTLNPSLIINRVSRESEGSYECKAIYAVNGQVETSAEVKLIVIDVLHSHYIKNEGDEATLEVRIFPVMSEYLISWYQNDVPIDIKNYGSVRKYSGGTSLVPSLTMKSVNLRDLGVYSCRITSKGISKRSINIQLFINQDGCNIGICFVTAFTSWVIGIVLSGVLLSKRLFIHERNKKKCNCCTANWKLSFVGLAISGLLFIAFSLLVCLDRNDCGRHFIPAVIGCGCAFVVLVPHIINKGVVYEVDKRYTEETKEKAVHEKLTSTEESIPFKIL